ncbi:putative nuclease HARBI1 [Mytilus trossulus]|uniref:putative nuclease HARBI1 n=1 Tax=Mytilus trossulus TaxID=6551 RepID=UPI003005FE47
MAALDLAFFHVPIQRKERTSKEELTVDYTDTELRARYRFGREGILFLSDLVRDRLTRQTNRNHALSVEQQTMVTLRFLASGSFLQVIGDLYDTLGLDKSTVSRVVDSVLDALCEKRNEFIQWPTNLNQTKAEFYEFAGFPNILGAIDGTHIRIKRPHHDEPSFINRKGYPSLNVQAVCDAKGRFTNINANWPGCCHDSHVFRTSQVCAHMERNGNWENGILLGDSGYPCRSFSMTHFLNPNEQHHRRYNRCHAVTRSIIERTFGRWKRCFHILHSEIRMDPKKVTKIVMVCGILHNICIQLNEPDVADELVNEDVENGNNYNGQQDGRGIREHIADTYFNRH